MADVGFLSSSRYLIHDRDSKFCESFRLTIESVGIGPIKLPARSPNLNSFAERWVRSAKTECLSNLILFGETSLRLALKHYVAHFHHERNHQGKGNLLLFPVGAEKAQTGSPGSLSGAAWWTAPFLPSGSRMSFLTLRALVAYSRLNNGKGPNRRAEAIPERSSWWRPGQLSRGHGTEDGQRGRLS